MMTQMKHNEYSADIRYSNEDFCFYGRVVGISDIVSFKGKSVEELKIAFENAINEYIEACREFDKEPEKPHSGKILFRCSEKMHKDITSFSAKKGLSINRVIENAISSHMYKGNSIVVNFVSTDKTEGVNTYTKHIDDTPFSVFQSTENEQRFEA
jgi:predicted HicB family RNase H-like nuclease